MVIFSSLFQLETAAYAISSCSQCETSFAASTCSVGSAVIQNTEMAEERLAMAEERLAKAEPLLGAGVGDKSGGSAESKCNSDPTRTASAEVSH